MRKQINGKAIKTIKMKQYSVLFLAAALFLASCGGSKKEDNASLNDLKVRLEKSKKSKDSADAAIRLLEEQIGKLDSSAGNVKAKLVSFQPVGVSNFEHFISLQGKVDAENISYVAPVSSGMGMGGGVVRAVYVKKGDPVHKGKLLLKLDDAIVQQQIKAAVTAMNTIKTQLDYAKNIYQRQKNVWEQGIGTEVQVITAKNNVTGLENQLKSAEEMVKVQREQLKTTNVYSDASGIADEVNIRVGENFTGQNGQGQPQIKIVNTSSLKVVVSVPENYVTRVQRGAKVEVDVPDAGVIKYPTSISLISQLIDISQRGFVAEAKISGGGLVKPNQTAIMRIRDYAAANAIIIPVNVVQTDEKGKYVFVAVKSGNGKITVVKRMVLIGEVSEDKVEIKSGLAAGEQLITEGYQSLYEGQLVTDKVQ